MPLGEESQGRVSRMSLVKINDADVEGVVKAWCLRPGRNVIGQAKLTIMDPGRERVGLYGFGDDLKILMTNHPENPVVFRGRIESVADVSFDKSIEIVARDYMVRLFDTVNVIEDYTSNNPATGQPWLISEVVADLRAKYLPDLGANIQATPGITFSSAFKSKRLFECIEELAGTAGISWRFFVDEMKVFNFIDVDSSAVVGEFRVGVNIIKYEAPRRGDQLRNRAFVYGATGIVAMVEDRDSIQKFGYIVESRFTDTNVQSVEQARDQARSVIDRYSDELRVVSFTTLGFPEVGTGDRIRLVIPSEEIDSVFEVVAVEYSFLPQVTTIKAAEWEVRLEDLIGKLRKDLHRIEASMADSDTPPTRFQTFYEDVSVKIALIRLRTRAIFDTFTLSHHINGRLGLQTFQPRLGNRQGVETVETLFAS